MGVAGVFGWILVVLLIISIHCTTDLVTRGPIESWARHSGSKLLRRGTVWWGWNPFSFNRSTSQVVYLLELEDPTGSRRSAYVKCGSPILGALFNPNELVVEFV